MLPIPSHAQYMTTIARVGLQASAHAVSGSAEGVQMGLPAHEVLLPGPELLQVVRGTGDKRVCVSHHTTVARLTHALLAQPGVEQCTLVASPVVCCDAQTAAKTCTWRAGTVTRSQGVMSLITTVWVSRTCHHAASSVCCSASAVSVLGRDMRCTMTHVFFWGCLRVALPTSNAHVLDCSSGAQGFRHLGSFTNAHPCNLMHACCCTQCLKLLAHAGK